MRNCVACGSRIGKRFRAIGTDCAKSEFFFKVEPLFGLWELKGGEYGDGTRECHPERTWNARPKRDDGFRKQVSTEEELSLPETVIEVLLSEFRKKWKKVFENQIK